MEPLQTDALKSLAQAEYDAADFAAAITHAEAVLKARPDDALAAEILAYSSIFSGNFKLATWTVSDAVKRHPEHISFLYLACKIALLKRDRERALELAQRLVQHHGGSPAANALAADCFMLWGQARTARSLLEKAVLLGNTAPDPFYHLGCLCLGDGDYTPALRNFLYAIDAGRRGTEAHVQAGHCYLGLRDLAAARRMCAHALAQGPGDLGAWELKFFVGCAAGDDEEIQQALSGIHHIDPTWTAPPRPA